MRNFLVIDILFSGYLGISQRVSGDENKIQFTSRKFYKVVENEIYRPTAEQYESFIEYLANMELWEKGYNDSNILDGTQWKCNIWNKDIRINTNGSNSYPPNFDEFMKEVRKLINGRKFWNSDYGIRMLKQNTTMC